MFRWVWIPLCIWVPGAFIGFFLTHPDALNTENWRTLCLIRVVWQWAGAIWFGISLTRFARSTQGAVKLVASLGLFGLLLCWGAVFDLIAGERIIRGEISTVQWHERYAPSTKYGTGSYYGVADFTVKNQNDSAIFTFREGEAHNFGNLKNTCNNGRVEVTYLRFLGRVLKYECVK
ncbi:MAG TPA: hypothetical protein VI112_03750 [Bacteroidia bacterium]|jgi:hypothetical protein